MSKPVYQFVIEMLTTFCFRSSSRPLLTFFKIFQKVDKFEHFPKYCKKWINLDTFSAILQKVDHFGHIFQCDKRVMPTFRLFFFSSMGYHVLSCSCFPEFTSYNTSSIETNRISTEFKPLYWSWAQNKVIFFQG